MIFEITDGLTCGKHPDMALCVIIDMTGVTHLHRHVELHRAAIALEDLLNQVRADLLAEAARADPA